jgi:hypothetical protein
MSDLHVPPAIAKIAPDGKLTPRQKRRFLIDMSLRKQKPGTGSSHEFMRRRTATYLLQAPDGTELDVLFGNYPWLEDALANPDRDAANYPVISLPYLILLKLEANRGRDVGDMTTMLGWASEEALATVREIIARYSPEDSDDLESLIYLGKLETESPTDED